MREPKLICYPYTKGVAIRIRANKKVQKLIQMSNLHSVIREANKDVDVLRKNWKNKIDVMEHYNPFYQRVKDEVNGLDYFITICLEDFKMQQQGMTMMGGGVLNKEGDTTIEIK